MDGHRTEGREDEKWGHVSEERCRAMSEEEVEEEGRCGGGSNLRVRMKEKEWGKETGDEKGRRRWLPEKWRDKTTTLA